MNIGASAVVERFTASPLHSVVGTTITQSPKHLSTSIQDCLHASQNACILRRRLTLRGAAAHHQIIVPASGFGLAATGLLAFI
jgi:hypothetical protein